MVARLLGRQGPGAADGRRAAADRGRRDRPRPDATRTRSSTVRGQARSRRRSAEVGRCTSMPDDPPACPESVEAVLAADWVVLGPGSWFTSVIPHLLVPELATAIQRHAGPADAHPQPRAGGRDRRVLAPPSTSSCWPSTRPTCGWTWCWPTALRRRRPAPGRWAALARGRAGGGRPRRPRRLAAARPAAAGLGVRRDHGDLSPARPVRAGRGRAGRPEPAWHHVTNGHDSSGEGGAGDHQGHQALLSQGRGRRDAEIRRAVCTSSAAGS